MSTPRTETSLAHRTSRKSTNSASPTITYHHSIVPSIHLPIPDIVHSAAGGAHYSGAPVSDSENGEVMSPSGESSQFLQGDEMIRDSIMADLKELYCCRPSKEIFERIWRPDAVYEVSLILLFSSTTHSFW